MNKGQGLAVLVGTAGVLGLSYIVLRASGAPPPPPKGARITSFQFSGSAGSPITFAGTGFTPTGAVEISAQGNAQGVISSGVMNADAMGSVGGTLDIPSTAPGGTYVFTLTDVTNNSLTASQNFTVTGSTKQASITLFQFGGAAGQIITFAGTGFTANGVVDYGVLGNNQGIVLSATVTADATGTVSGSATVPSTTPTGLYFFTLVDETNANLSATKTFNVTGVAMGTQITSFQYDGLPGGIIQFSVVGLTPNKTSTVGILGNNQGILYSATASNDASGAIPFGLVQVPATAPPGLYFLTIVDDTNANLSASQEFSVT